MSKTKNIILVLRPRELQVHVDGILMPDDQTDGAAFAMTLRMKMNPEIRLAGVKVDENETPSRIEAGWMPCPRPSCKNSTSTRRIMTL